MAVSGALHPDPDHARTVPSLPMAGLPSVELAVARRMAASGEARRIREASGLTNPEIARDIGTAPNTPRRWEKGERVPHGEAAVRWVLLLRQLEREALTDAAVGGAA